MHLSLKKIEQKYYIAENATTLKTLPIERAHELIHEGKITNFCASDSKPHKTRENMYVFRLEKEAHKQEGR